MVSSPSSVTIRPVEPADVPTVFALIRALAEYEQLSHEVVGTEAALYAHLFGDRPYIESFLVEENGTPAGFALFFKIYSVEIGTPGYYLEDLFVFPEFRGRGLGKALLAALAQRALEQGFQHLQWSVLDWNAPAIAFYQTIGADVHPHQRIARITGDGLTQASTIQTALTPFTAQWVDADFLTNMPNGSSSTDHSPLPATFLEKNKASLRRAIAPPSSQVEALAIYHETTLVGLATFTHSYSTFLTQPGLLIESMVVAPGDRAAEIQHTILQTLAALATERQCGRLEWLVHQDDEQAIAQCQHMGGTVRPDWRICRMNAGAIATLATQVA